MDFFNIAGMIYLICAFGLFFYSLIGWIVVLIIDKSSVRRRKKYSYMCLISMLMFAVGGILSFIINFRRNTM